MKQKNVIRGLAGLSATLLAGSSVSIGNCSSSHANRFYQLKAWNIQF